MGELVGNEFPGVLNEARGHLSGRECPFEIAFLKRKTVISFLQISGGKRNILYKI